MLKLQKGYNIFLNSVEPTTKVIKSWSRFRKSFQKRDDFFVHLIIHLFINR